MSNEENIYWDIYHTLSYNALFNFIIGPRGNGKSYGCKKRAIENFLNKDEQFAYVRRFKTELKKKDLATYFDDIKEEFSDHTFEVKNKKFYIDDKLAGHSFALSTAKIKKSVPYPKISMVIFDEFILDKGYHHYIPDEVTNFLELYETIARLRDVQVFFLSNAITWTNPYFTYFEIDPPKNKKKIGCDNDILIQIVDNQNFINKKKNTRFGKIIDNTPYGDYAIETKFLRDSDNFVAKTKPKNKKMHFILIVGGKKLGVWLCPDEGVYYVSKKFDPSYKLIYTASNEDHKPNTMLLKGRNRSSLFKDFVENYKVGNVFFDSVDTKNRMLKIMKIAM